MGTKQTQWVTVRAHPVRATHILVNFRHLCIYLYLSSLSKLSIESKERNVPAAISDILFFPIDSQKKPKPKILDGCSSPDIG